MPDPQVSIIERMHPAARVSDGETTWNAEQLKDAVQAWRGQLDEMGVEVVAFDLPNGLDWVALDLALFESGRAAVPMPGFFSAQQQAAVLRDSGAEALVVLDDADYVPPAVEVAEVHKAGGCAILLLCPEQQASLPVGTAIVTYTSGSTGNPKGVCLDHATLLDTAQSIVNALRSENIERHLSVLPLTLLLENVAGLFANLLNGSEILVPELSSIGVRGSSDVDIAVLAGSIASYNPQSLILVPALLLGLTFAAEFKVADFSGLRFAAVGGGRVADALLDRATAQGIPVYEGYGLTECGSVVTLNLPGRARKGTVGELLPHVRAQVVDGELVVEQPRLLGIVGQDQARPDCVHTGDRVELSDDGYLSVHGRLKNMFITAFGRNVSPEWVEGELSNELCIGLSAVFGEAMQTNAALIIPRGEPSDEDIQAAIDRCNATLPDYARIGHWMSMDMESFKAGGGVTGNGRVKRDVAQAIVDPWLQSLTEAAAGAAHATIEQNRSGANS